LGIIAFFVTIALNPGFIDLLSFKRYFLQNAALFFLMDFGIFDEDYYNTFLITKGM